MKEYKVGNFVLFARMPEWVGTLPKETQDAFQHCLGQKFAIQEISPNGDIVLDVSGQDGVLGEFQNDIRLGPEFLDPVPKEIRFYGRRYAAYRFMSNFYACTLLLDGKVWSTVEHYYQAMKTNIESEQEMIRLAHSPGDAKKWGGPPEHGGKITIREDWNHVKEDVMRKALREKFADAHLRQKLMETEDATLIEASPSDYYWGEGATHTGMNRLGVLLMEIREEIRHGPKPDESK